MYCKSTTIDRWSMVMMILAVILIAACSSGSDSSSSATTDDIRALSLPDRIELSNVEDTGASSSRTARSMRGAYSDTGTDYSNQTKSSWVDDTDALDMINDVLGVCKETSYSNFVNQGAYKALVSPVGESDQSQSGNSTTNTTVEQLQEVYVNVTRASNDDPMIVKIWVEEEDGPGGQAMLIRGYFTVEQGVSDDYPYGVMTAHFKGVALDSNGNEGDELFTMALSVDASGSNVILENVDDCNENNFEFHRKVRVVANEDVTEGNAYVSTQETDWDTGQLPDATVVQISFNADYFKSTEEGSDPVVSSKASLYHRVFNYKLFDASTGEKVTRTSGYPIQTANGEHAYIGYYGIWAPHGITISHGATVTDMDGNEYTVFRASGKLTKHTQADMALSALNGTELSKWVCDQSGCQDTIVAWDSDSDTFITLGYRNQETGQINYYEESDNNYHAAVTFDQWEGAWCEALSAYLRLGNLYYDENGQATTPDDSTTVYYHTEQTLNPGDATDLNLYTWSYTLDMPITQTIIDNADESTYWQNPSEKTFTFDAENMMLNFEGEAVVIGSDIDLSNSNYQYGYHIAPLTTAHYYNGQSPFFWEAHEAETYYTWNTGSNDWNQFATLVDSNGAFVSFDAPISFSYTHSTSNDVNGDSTYDGKTFRLEYDGFSVMIPWEFDESTSEWQPLINIKDGVAMGPNGDDYVIKATDEALIMQTVTNEAVLASITFNEETVDAPSLTYDATKTALVGDMPTSAELKVIKGELVSSE